MRKERKTSIAYVIGELFFYRQDLNAYVSRFSAVNFLKLLQEELDLECSFVFPVSEGIPPDTYSASIEAEKYNVVALPGWSGVISYYRILLDLRKYFHLKRKIIDLVKYHDIFWIRIPHPFGLWLGRAAEQKGKTVIYNVVGDIRLAYRSPKFHGLKKVLARMAGGYFHKRSMLSQGNSTYLCVGSCLFESYKRKGKRAEYFVHSVVKSSGMNPPKKELGEPLSVLYVGKLERSKGIYLLIEAMLELAGKRKDIVLHIAGHGTEEQRIRGLSESNKNITFHGFVPQGGELDMIYNKSDILVVPTIQYPEGFPRVILEAWSHGLFVISSDVGGIRGLGKDGENILFFNPGNKESMIGRIEMLLGDSDLREKLKRGIIEVQNKISSENMIGKIKSIVTLK